MKIVVKSHKRNGRVVKSHMRKSAKKKVLEGIKRNRNSTDSFYGGALDAHPKTGHIRFELGQNKEGESFTGTTKPGTHNTQGISWNHKVFSKTRKGAHLKKRK